MRVLKWIIDRCHGQAYGVESPLGWMPRTEDIELDGLGLSRQDLEAVQAINPPDIKAELMSQQELFLKMAADLPKEMIFERELLVSRL
jgi:phosphoenolpyruvate carboxykinase (GTP)